MKVRFTCAMAAGLLFNLACGSKVEIGHGTPGGSSGNSAAGDAETGGIGNPQPQGGGGTQTAGDAAVGGEETGGTTPTGGTSSDPGSGAGIVGAPGPADNGPQAQVGKVD